MIWNFFVNFYRLYRYMIFLICIFQYMNFRRMISVYVYFQLKLENAESEDDMLEEWRKMNVQKIYLQNASNLPFNLTDQIVTMNDLVCEYAVPRVYNEARGYLSYKNDISTMYTPMARPYYSDYKTNSLQLKPWY